MPIARRLGKAVVLPSRAVFGFSFSELIVVAIVALVIFGPKDLPNLLRRLGQYAAKIRRAAADLRAQSGIDDALRTEGLASDIAELRKLARGEIDAVQRVARIEPDVRPMTADPYPARSDDFYVVRDREYPREGADSYHALPDNAVVYVESMPKSALARDPLYLLGDADAELPPEEEPAAVPYDPTAPVPTLIGGVAVAPTDASGTAPTDGAAPTDDAAAPPPSPSASADLAER